SSRGPPQRASDERFAADSPTNGSRFCARGKHGGNAMPNEPMNEAREELLDRLVAEYSDRRARGVDRAREGLLQQVDAEHRAALAHCFDMIDAGLTAPASTSAPLSAGTELDGYCIEKLLGRGGMATVYLAKDLR